VRVVRDPHAWSNYLTETIDTFGDRSEVVFASHHWPTWGNDRIVEYLSLQRDLYAYLHDQTLRMLNKGLVRTEIAEDFTLPPALENAWHTRGYYGSVSHNVKAIYQRYLGWFDGNPARLWQHRRSAGRATSPPSAGSDRVTEKAQEAYDAGDFRWAATSWNHAVFTDPDHEAAAGPVRRHPGTAGLRRRERHLANFFLSGATELQGRPLRHPDRDQRPRRDRPAHPRNALRRHRHPGQRPRRVG
jgi:alkyl sulfatase BDS1-like metallo-beta-lactamase superfamily hydrolase